MCFSPDRKQSKVHAAAASYKTHIYYNIFICVYIDTMYISTPTPPIYALPGLRAPAAVGPFVRKGAGAAATPGRVLQGATPGAESGRQIPWGLGQTHGKPMENGKKMENSQSFIDFHG